VTGTPVFTIPGAEKSRIAHPDTGNHFRHATKIIFQSPSYKNVLGHSILTVYLHALFVT
jgi:hypothetical protein